MDLKALAALADALWNGRSNINAKMDEIAKYVYPDGAGFNSPLSESEEGRDEIWDAAPEEASGILQAALGGMLTNPAVNWLNLDIVGLEELGEEEADWLTHVSRLILDELSRPECGFYNEADSLYGDLVPFGWGVFLVEYHDGEGLYFKAIAPKECALAENANGRVDTVLRRFMMTASQLVEKYGADKVPEKIKSAAESDGQKSFEITHIVMPRAKYPKKVKLEDGLKLDDDDSAEIMSEDALKEQVSRRLHPFIGVTFEKDAEEPLQVDGYFEMPYACPRWKKRSGEVYGRGPGHAALPEMRTLNKVAFAQLNGAEKQSDPPLLAPDDSYKGGSINSYAGGITHVRETSGPGIRPIPLAIDLKSTQGIIEKNQEAIRRKFLNDRIQLVGGPQMTATEVIARERNKAMILGPVQSRLEADYLGPVTERIFGLLHRAGHFKVPDSLMGMELRVHYVSPISRAQKQGEAEGFSLALNYLAPMLQASPAALDNFNADEIARDSKELFGYPPKYLRDEAEVKEIRKARAEAAAAEARAAQAAQAAEAAKANGPAQAAPPDTGVA